MTATFSEAEVFAEVTALTRPRLLAWVEARIVQPVQSGPELRYREVDLARLQTLCDLADGFDLSSDSLALVMDLIDRLHEHRTELESLMAALAAEPEDVRLRLRQVILTLA